MKLFGSAGGFKTSALNARQMILSLGFYWQWAGDILAQKHKFRQETRTRHLADKRESNNRKGKHERLL